jgi:Mn2+/Fe2+ NRAMP family transporter
VFAANVLNIGADLGAMAEASALLLPLPGWIYVVFFGVVCTAGQVFLRHTRYVSVLKWLTLTLFAYFGTVAVVKIPWDQLLTGLFIPTLHFDRDFWLTVVAILGTTISPYLFFWQAAQEMEDLRAVTARNGGGSLLPHAAEVARLHLRRIRWDTYIGMGFSNLIAFFIILSTAATLHTAGTVDIQTSAQAAEALRPLGGETTFLLFSLGIIGTGMLAVPVLAGSAAYAVSESFDWQSGLDRKVHEALEFYGIIAIATVGGVALTFTHLDPVRALVWSAEINGVIAVPIMAVMMLLAAREDIMGRFVIRLRLRRLGWIATAVMAVTVAAMIVTT